MRGGLIEWENYRGQIILSRILWVVLLIAAVLAVWKFHFKKCINVIRYISFFMMAMFTLTLAMETVLQGSGVLSHRKDIVSTTKDLMEMSENRNVIVLLMDMLDTTRTEEIIDANKEYEDSFADFTFFRNTAGGYAHTKESLPLIVSGRWYEYSGDFSGFSTDCFKNSDFLYAMENDGYKLDWYGGITYNDDSAFRFENRKSVPLHFVSKGYFWSLLARLVGLKYGPYFIKEYCVVAASDFDEKLKVRNSEGYDLFSSKLLNFYDMLEDSDFTKTEQSCFKFIHLEGAHQGYDISPDLVQLENGSGTYEWKCEAALKVAARYIEELKENGVYDNTALVIMADHGNKDIHLGRDPFLMVKGFGEKHEMENSYAPISFEDLHGAFIKLSNGDGASEIFDYKDGDQRSRRFLFYYQFFEDHIYEYEIKGDVLDDGAISETGKVYVKDK